MTHRPPLDSEEPLNLGSSTGALRELAKKPSVSQMCHRFWKKSGPTTGFKRFPALVLNSRIFIRPPIYQLTHGPRTVRHFSLKIQACD